MQDFIKLLRYYVDEYGGGKPYIFASELGVSNGSIYYWLRSEKAPSLQTLIQLSNALEKITGEPYSEILTKFILTLPRG